MTKLLDKLVTTLLNHLSFNTLPIVGNTYPNARTDHLWRSSGSPPEFLILRQQNHSIGSQFTIIVLNSSLILHLTLTHISNIIFCQ